MFFWKGKIDVEFQRASFPIKEAFLAADNPLLYPQSGFRVNSQSGYYRAVSDIMLDITRDLLRDIQLAAAAVAGVRNNKVSELSLSGLTLSNLLPCRIPDAKRFECNLHRRKDLSEVFHFLGFKMSNLYGIDICFCLLGFSCGQKLLSNR